MSVVHHIAMSCRDQKSQELFYTKHLGFRRSRVFNEGKPNEFRTLRLGAISLEFFTADPKSAGQTGGEQPVGFKHIAFEVPDIEKTVAAIQADGIKTDKILDCSSNIPGLRVCFFRDPDGNWLELMQGWRDQM